MNCWLLLGQALASWEGAAELELVSREGASRTVSSEELGTLGTMLGQQLARSEGSGHHAASWDLLLGLWLQVLACLGLWLQVVVEGCPR